MNEKKIKCIVIGKAENLQQIEAGKQLAISEGWKEEEIVVCRTDENFSELRELLDKRVGYVADVYIVDLPRITTDYKVVEQLIEEVNEVRPIRFVVSGDDFFFESIEVVDEKLYRAIFNKVVDDGKEYEYEAGKLYDLELNEEDKKLLDSNGSWAYSNEPTILTDKLTHTCSICGCPIEGYGHNAQPILNGRCCSVCNADIVFPTRARIGLTPDELLAQAIRRLDKPTDKAFIHYLNEITRQYADKKDILKICLFSGDKLRKAIIKDSVSYLRGVVPVTRNDVDRITELCVRYNLTTAFGFSRIWYLIREDSWLEKCFENFVRESDYDEVLELYEADNGSLASYFIIRDRLLEWNYNHKFLSFEEYALRSMLCFDFDVYTNF